MKRKRKIALSHSPLLPFDRLPPSTVARRKRTTPLRYSRGRLFKKKKKIKRASLWRFDSFPFITPRVAFLVFGLLADKDDEKETALEEETSIHF